MNKHTKVAPATTLRGQPLPSGWICAEARLDGAAYVNIAAGGMSVIESIATELDGRRWHHVSVARPDRVPTWDDIAMVKRVWLGHGVLAIQVIPPTSKHVNIHPYCLHLWSCAELGSLLPDFTRGGKTI